MWKKRKMDFIISEDKYSKIIFRFYPRQSSCHGFGDEPPKDWSGVYKVYYSYKIIKVWKDDNDYMVLFDSGVDECSIIDEIANRMKLISEGTIVYRGTTKDNEEFSIRLLNNEVFPFGDGVSWNIQRIRRTNKYSIMLFDSWNKGYRFVITIDKMKEFAKFLEECCEYMLAHGDPI